jgi:uncharacterized SAM-binding protein YcdF (DUF218 family)
MMSLAGLVHPFGWLFVLLAAALVWAWKRSESRRRLVPAVVLFALLWVYCMPLTSHFALATLEWNYPPQRQIPQDEAMIVVLSGGMAYGDELVPESKLSEDTVQRCFEGAALYHAGAAKKLLLTGGKVNAADQGPQLADAMLDLMKRLQVPGDAILLERNSRSTFENAVESCRILKEHHAGRVVLVTDAAHLPRAVRCFRAQGIDVIPWGCRYRARPLQLSFRLIIPHPSAAEGMHAAIHEWLGLAWYWVQGRI